MNAKNVLLSAVAVVILTAFTPAARAQVAPTQGVAYFCSHYQGGTYVPGLSGISIFTWNYQNVATIKRGIEEYWWNNGTHDNRKVDFFYQGYAGGGWYDWEFTIKDGPQCKDTFVRYDARVIQFTDCTDGHLRVCSR